MQEKLFLFGTGRLSERYTQLLSQMSIEIEGYVDNDTDKWGTYFNSKKIHNPDIFLHCKNFKIVIACADREGVSKQLFQMKLHHQIISIEQLIYFYIKENAHRICSIAISGLSPDKPTLIIDNLDGKWGGAEDWSRIVTASFLERGYQAFLVENSSQESAGKVAKEHILSVHTEGQDEYHIFLELVHILAQRRPFVLFNVRNSVLLWAAITVKYVCPKEVHIISFLLNDHTYEKFCAWDESVDSYVCISSRIYRNLIHRYRINQKKAYCCLPFVEKERRIRKNYHIEYGQPIRIGYPCRLVKNQKRADLLPEFIMCLEHMGVNYLLSIAGEGPCEALVKVFVEKHHLHKKVKFYGRLTRTELSVFLEHQDIYLNFSEFEGTSLTMLEAMASGCVPVVTNVSGVDDFIESGVNGLIADAGDLKSIAEHIGFLDRNRNLLVEYGQKSIDAVHEKCGLDRYVNMIEKILKSL